MLTSARGAITKATVTISRSGGGVLRCRGGCATGTIVDDRRRCIGGEFGRRWYRGDSGEMKHRREVVGDPSSGAGEDPVLRREEELLRIAKPRYDAIYADHVKMPKLDSLSDDALYGVGQHRQGGAASEAEDGRDYKERMELLVRKKRLVYRSKQRGWLEVDLLLGTWASQFVPTLSAVELDEFERFVNLETIDIYNVLTLRTDIPDEFIPDGEGDGGQSSENKCVGVVRRIQEWAKASPLGKAEPAKYASVKMDHNLI